MIPWATHPPPAIIYTHYASDLDKLVPISHLHNEEYTRQPRRNISSTQGNNVDLAFQARGGSGQRTAPPGLQASQSGV